VAIFLITKKLYIKNNIFPMEKKVYESKKIYGKKYNKLNINVQLNRELIDNLRKKLENQGISIKDYIENLIKNDN
jgi:hypothetical protein